MVLNPTNIGLLIWNGLPFMSKNIVRIAFVHWQPILQKIAHRSDNRCREAVLKFPHFSFHNDIKDLSDPEVLTYCK